MEWPFEKGGVNLAGRAVLEMPSFNGPPEVILNGWIDALLHIRDYARTAGDVEAMDFFKANIQFLVDILPVFDCREAGISRYSDVSPYRAWITLATPADIDSIRLLYRPKFDYLKPILIRPGCAEGPESFSPYDNHIVRRNGRKALVWLTASQLYDTVVIAKSGQLEVSLNTGSIARSQSTPGFAGGEERLFVGGELGEGELAASFGADDGLICGYPTNFSKGGTTNYYHVYHVVGLMLLALGGEVSEEQKRSMLSWSLKWRDDIRRLSKEGLIFVDPQILLTKTNENQFAPHFSDYDAMIQKAIRTVGM